MPLQHELRPELKQVTVLFADICGSTSQVTGRHPEHARNYLERALGTMADSVQRFGGTVSQRRGDGLLALFGAPMAQQDHALRACLAALDMQSRMPASRGGGHAVRVGIHSGEALVGLAADYLGSYYRADGPTVHLASRLERLAQAGQVVTTEATLRQVELELDAVALGSHEVKDFSGSLPLYAVRQRSQSAAAPLTRRRHWTPLFARGETLAWLHAGLQRAQGGTLVVRGLCGEAGIGKSRVLVAFGDEAEREGARRCTVQGRAYLSGSAQALVADLARALLGCGVPTATDAEHLLRLHGVVPAQHLPALCDLLGLADGDAPWRSLAPTKRRNRTVDALQWLLQWHCAAQPLVLVLEDVFLADDNSARILVLLLQRLVTQPLLVCLSYRERLPLQLADPLDFAESALPRLPGSDSVALVSALLGSDPSLHGVIEALAERAGGNPLFLEQLAIALIDDQTVVGPPGDYRLASQRPTLRVPSSVLAVVGELVDRLPPAAKAALEAAAVLGDPIAAEDVAAMQHISVHDAHAQLRLCVGPGLLSDGGDGATAGSYGFRHALVLDSVLATPHSQRRRQLHREALRVMRARVGEKPGDRAAVLLQHALHGEVWADAVGLAAQAMAHAASRSANREADSIFRSGLRAAQHVEPASAGAALEIGLRLEAIGMMLPMGRVEEILANLRDAEQLAERLADPRAQIAIASQLAAVLWMRGQYTDGLQQAERALAAAVAAGRRTAQMTVEQVRVMLLHGLGRYREAVVLGEHVRSAFAAELGQRRNVAHWATIPSINLLSFLGSAHWRLGDTQAAQHALDEAYVSLASDDHPYSRGLIDFVQAQVWLEVGRAEPALALMQKAVASCEVNDVPTLRPCMLALLGRALADSGQASQAADLMEQGFAERVHEPGGTYGEFFMRTSHAHALCRAGAYELAVRKADAAVAFAQSGEQHGHLAEALGVLAEALVQAGQPEDARAQFWRALQQARRCGMRALAQRAARRLREVDAGLSLTRPEAPAHGARGGKPQGLP